MGRKKKERGDGKERNGKIKKEQWRRSSREMRRQENPRKVYDSMILRCERYRYA